MDVWFGLASLVSRTAAILEEAVFHLYGRRVEAVVGRSFSGQVWYLLLLRTP